MGTLCPFHRLQRYVVQCTVVKYIDDVHFVVSFRHSLWVWTAHAGLSCLLHFNLEPDEQHIHHLFWAATETRSSSTMQSIRFQLMFPGCASALLTSKPTSFLVVIGRHMLLMVDKNISVYAWYARDLRHVWRLAAHTKPVQPQFDVLRAQSGNGNIIRPILVALWFNF